MYFSIILDCSILTFQFGCIFLIWSISIFDKFLPINGVIRIPSIKEKGFILANGNNITLKGKRKFIVPKTKFENDVYILTVYQIEKYSGLSLEVENKFVKIKKAIPKQNRL